MTGVQGTGYDYVMAQHGVYVQSQNHRMTARVLLAPAPIRGLLPAEPTLRLHPGLIPAALLDLGISAMLAQPHRESMFGIRWQDNAYHLVFPEQSGAATSLQYQPIPDLVAEFHSHGAGPAFFSATDDADEQGFGLYGVVGRLQSPLPEIAVRVGIYGHFGPLVWEQAFTGLPNRIRILNTGE